MAADLIGDLRAHLLREAEALLGGDLAALPAIAAEKEALAERLRLAPRPALAASGLADLRALASRNAALLAAAQRGIASARERIRDLGRVATGLGTYAADGSRLPLARSPHLSRRS